MSKYKEELLATELEPIGEYVPLLDVIYVIPTRRKHDSGYMCMEIVGENKSGNYKKKLATSSDVIDFKGMFLDSYSVLSMDMEETGIMRFFSRGYRFKVVFFGISSFVVELVKDGEVHE